MEDFCKKFCIDMDGGRFVQSDQGLQEEELKEIDS